MTNYLRKVLYDFPDTIQGIAATPEAEHLLTVRYNTDRRLLY